MTAALPSDQNSTRIADHNTIIANCSTITADHSTIRANRAGEYLVHVMLDGEDVLDSPFPLSVGHGTSKLVTSSNATSDRHFPSALADSKNTDTGDEEEAEYYFM